MYFYGSRAIVCELKHKLVLLLFSIQLNPYVGVVPTECHMPEGDEMGIDEQKDLFSIYSLIYISGLSKY